VVDPGEEVRFAPDSPLEGSGFEPPVPQMHLVEQLFGASIDQVLGTFAEQIRGEVGGPAPIGSSEN
jgi:hypothetical protein